ncbi:putative ribosomal protein S5/S7 [Septoria linicola]|nr:putative ribosomal protein S5/S7 [Septoria linicola]
MPSAINPFPVLRTVAFRPRPAVVRRSNVVAGVTRRTFADSKDVPNSDGQAVGPNTQQAEHVSEEAAKMAKIQGGEGPDIEGQGTPVQDILKEEKDIRKNAPQVMKEDAKAGNTTKPQTRSFSTYARRRAEVESSSSSAAEIEQAFDANAAAEYTATATTPSSAEPKGHKFALPPIPLPRELVKDHRYDPVVTQVTNLLMKDGKKSVAQRNMSVLLNILRTSPAPTYNPSRPLLPGAPPASHLPLNPTLYLTLAVDSVAPLLRIRSQRGAAGGGVALQIPVPLGLRQRRRTAFMWILDAAVKRKSKGSGNDMFAQKVAEEIIAIVEGRSAVWEKRTGVHKLATTARANLNYSMRGRR